jgi:transposase-like protein
VERILSKKKSSSGKWPWRYPQTAAGIQVNHCKNPRCANFGVPPKDTPATPKGGARAKGVKLERTPEPGDYIVVASGRKDPALKCKLCNEVIPMQSNLAIAEELLRISAYLEPPGGPACTNDECEFYEVPVTKAPKNYVRFGTSTHGTPRYRCKACKSVFAYGGKATHRQRETHRNRDIFEHLVNSVPLRRIIKLLGITPGTLYRQIDFIWRQCRQFAGERERMLVFANNLGKRYITVDRQALMVNWVTRKDRRNTQLLSCGSADLETGYVFGIHLNYDPDLDVDAVLADMPRYGDDKLAQPFRRYARVWLPPDFEDAARRSGGTKRDAAATGLESAIEATYADATSRENVEAGNGPQPSTRVPVRGMQIHEQIVLNNADDFKRFISEFNEILNENTNNLEIRRLLSERGEPVVSGAKGNKLLQRVYEIVLSDTENLIAPFYYLYDLRLWADHSTGGKYLEDVSIKLGVPQNEYKLLMEALIAKLAFSANELLAKAGAKLQLWSICAVTPWQTRKDPRSLMACGSSNCSPRGEPSTV